MKTHTRTAHTGKKEHKWSTTGILSNHKCSQIWSLWFTIVNKIWLNIHTRYGWLVGCFLFACCSSCWHTHMWVCVFDCCISKIHSRVTQSTAYIHETSKWEQQINTMCVCTMYMHTCKRREQTKCDTFKGQIHPFSGVLTCWELLAYVEKNCYFVTKCNR